MFKISVIICTYNRSQYLNKAFNSIKHQSLNSSDFEIIVVNNNSTDNTESICIEFEKSNPNLHFKYITESKQGLSYARNRGIAEASGRLITFIDDDAWADPNFLERSVKYLEQDLKIAVVGGKIYLDYELKRPLWVTRFLESLFGFYDLGETPKKFNKSYYPRGSNMTYRREIFENYGGFNEELGRKGSELIGNEEKELFIRILKYGETGMYYPDLLVYHAVPEARTQISFVKKQAIGFGKSEWLRVKNLGFLAAVLLAIKELAKWVVSIGLFMTYLIIFNPSKGSMLIKFRYWVLQGIKNN